MFTRCLPDLHRHFKHFEQRKEVPPPSAILQASRGVGEEVRIPGRWSRGGLEECRVVSLLFGKKTFIQSLVSCGLAGVS